jgi:hypothetical protein
MDVSSLEQRRTTIHSIIMDVFVISAAEKDKDTQYHHGPLVLSTTEKKTFQRGRSSDFVILRPLYVPKVPL